MGQTELKEKKIYKKHDNKITKTLPWAYLLT